VYMSQMEADKNRPHVSVVTIPAGIAGRLSLKGVLYKGLVLILGVALSVSAGFWWSYRRELHIVNGANDSLRKTLGELTIAITDKDKQIDKLLQSPCASPEQSRPAARRP